MKFGKRLKRQIEDTLPEWRDKFLSYEDLKKLLRLISSSTRPSHEAQADFIYFLDAELDKLNAFFVEQEEDFVIRQRELQETIKRVAESYGPAGSQPSDEDYEAEMARTRKDMVDLHGEMVLLENYSSINYTGMVKILKKYDKRTGGLLRLPFVEKVLKQPFFSADLIISKLVKECESTVDAVFPMAQQRIGERKAAVGEEESIFRSTVAALVTMQELRKGSSTYSHFSLPPMSLPEADLLQCIQLPSPIPIQ